jgi:K+-transporting ATPase KdpF subunit
VTLLQAVALVVAVLLLAYLTAALLKPEWFA